VVWVLPNDRRQEILAFPYAPRLLAVFASASALRRLRQLRWQLGESELGDRRRPGRTHAGLAFAGASARAPTSPPSTARATDAHRRRTREPPTTLFCT
jgi:hypothetical protein